MTKRLDPKVKALRRVLRYAQAGKLGATNGDGSCLYENKKTRKFCAIGCLLPKEVRATVHERRLNDAGAHILYARFKGLEKMTGLTQAQAERLQSFHDSWTVRTFPSFIRIVKSILAGKQDL